MKPSHVASLIRSRLSSNHHRPIHLEGSPGLGKTQIPAQIARESDIGFLAVHAPMLPPEDLGYPVINSDRTDVSFVVSKSRFPLIGSSHPARGILLIDELVADAGDNAALFIAGQTIDSAEQAGLWVANCIQRLQGAAAA